MGTQANALPRPWFTFDEHDSTFVYGIAFWLALIQVSIAASQIVLGGLVCVWAYRVARGELTLPALPITLPFALYAGTSVLSALFSFDPAMSLAASKKLLLLVVPYLLVSALRRRASVETLVLVLVLIADIGALVGLWQYQFGNLDDLNHRIHGFVGHYMTYAGLLMGVGILAIAQLLFHDRYRRFLVASLALIGFALLLSLTRSAWIGTTVGALLLAFLKDKRLLLWVPVIAVVLAMLLPRSVESRLGTVFRPDTSGVDRVYMLQSGAGMIANHPWLGVGPNMVAEIYPIYAAREAPHRDNPHLHNNLMQIAAERGLLCLAAWVWMLAVAFIASGRAFKRTARDPRSRALAAGSLGVLVAGVLAGLFEYNFGDSEFQMLFLFAMAIPWVLERARDVDEVGA